MKGLQTIKFLLILKMRISTHIIKWVQYNELSGKSKRAIEEM